MPELPEVETVARSLAPHMEGGVILSGEEIAPCLLEGSFDWVCLAGACVRKVHRRGKLIVIDLEMPSGDDLFLVVHLRMTGSLLVRKEGDWKSLPHARAVFHMEDGKGCPQDVVFSDVRTFGRILIADEERLSRWKFWKTLGPEPLEMSAELFCSRICGGRGVKTVLLDQKVIAGIGNIYADESLFAAGIHPARIAASLSDEERVRLFVELKRILDLSISECGSSIRDYIDANGNAGAFQNMFKAYGRGGKSCLVCSTPMIKERMAGRGTVWCPVCQPLGGKKK